MPKAVINGLSIAYEIIGNGSKNAIITPGGRYSKDSPGVRQLAQELAKHDFRTVIWDRPNCGESDICFEAESESIMNAETLAALLKHLEMTPALLFGGSAGGRVSLMATQRHPEIANKIVLLWLTAGYTMLAALIGVYCGELERDAMAGGMEAVARSRFLAECIERNPANLERLLAYDVEGFSKIMQKWAKSLWPAEGSPIPGLLPHHYAEYKVPVLIFRSDKSDFAHRTFVTDQVHALIPGSQMVDPAWPESEWNDRSGESEHALFKNWWMLAPQVVAFDRATS